MKVVILGWRRNKLKKFLDDCEIISNKFVKANYDVYTGAGSGFMMRGNKGAFEFNKNKSFGITTKCLYNKEGQNNFILPGNKIITSTFAERKELLFKDANILVFFPGGMGTLDEFTDIMNLIKTKEYKPVKIILYGYKYWHSLISWFEFNNIKFPMKYIDNIIDSVEEFDSKYKLDIKIDDFMRNNINDFVNNINTK